MKLKPCPFCGNTDDANDGEIFHKSDCYLKHLTDYATRPYDKEEREAWNLRIPTGDSANGNRYRKATMKILEKLFMILALPVVVLGCFVGWFWAAFMNGFWYGQKDFVDVENGRGKNGKDS